MNLEKIIIFFVSALFAVILYILLPVESEKYRLSLEEQEFLPRLAGLHYVDLDGDREVELVRGKKGDPVPAIVVQKSDHRVIDQWNLNGEWVDGAEFFLSDFDHDHFREIVCFTYYNDSVWIHVIEPLQEHGTSIHKALERVSLFNGNQDWEIFFGIPEDMNGDGFDDFTFTIRAGFTIKPRSLYLFDPSAEITLNTDIDFGNNIHTPLLVDLDGDGIKEITGNMSAHWNITSEAVMLADTCSWFLLFDEHLQFKTPPIPYHGKPSYLRVLPVRKEERQLLITYHFSRMVDSLVNRMEVWEWIDDSLQVISSRDLEYGNQIMLLDSDAQQNGCFYISQGDFVIKLNEMLEEVQQIKADLSYPGFPYLSQELDGDGLEERIMFTNERRLTIARNDFRHPVSLDLGFQKVWPQISTFSVGEIHYINVFRNHLSQIIRYSRNPFYPFRYLILVLSFIAYYLIFSLISDFQRKRIEKRQASERQLLHYQFTNVVQQLDPHFLFNALSNISSYYHKGDVEHAQSYLAKLSRLVRITLENSEKMTISLQEEIQFVEDFLSVEKIRMGDRLEFFIDIDEALKQKIQIPKMLIQGFVENAVKHGIRHLIDRKGLIRIFSIEEHGYIRIIIEDNGIGRAKAIEIGSVGTGNGLKMAEKMLHIFEKLEKVKISFEITDLVDEVQIHSGTRVTLYIPERLIGKS